MIKEKFEKGKNIFVGYVGWWLDWADISVEFSNKIERGYMPGLFPGVIYEEDKQKGNIFLAQIVDPESEVSTPPYIFNYDGTTIPQGYSGIPLMTVIKGPLKNVKIYVANYDNEQLKNAALESGDYFIPEEHISSREMSFHDYVPIMMSKYPDDWFLRLKSQGLDVTYLIYDRDTKTLSALKLGNQSNLYFGLTRVTKEVFISNNAEIVKKLCDEIFEVDYDCYYDNGNFYYVEEPEKAPVLVKKTNTIK